MDNVLTLPPMLSGKVTGCLYLTILEIDMFNNSTSDINGNNLVLVQWWGEILPVVLRPRIQYENNLNGPKNQSVYRDFVIYEIKTSEKLFKEYLKSCEKLELIVTDRNGNLVIGSAFLENLVYVLQLDNELIILPIIDFMGEIIGKIKIFINFIRKLNKEECKKYLVKNKYPSGIDLDQLQKNATHGIIEKDKNYDIKNFKYLELSCKCGVSEKKVSKNESNNISCNFNTKYVNNRPSNENFSSAHKSESDNKNLHHSKQSIVKHTTPGCVNKVEEKQHDFPQVHLFNDCSKIIHFNLIPSKSSKNSKKKISKKLCKKNQNKTVEHESMVLEENGRENSNGSSNKCIDKKFYCNICKTSKKAQKNISENSSRNHAYLQEHEQTCSTSQKKLDSDLYLESKNSDIPTNRYFKGKVLEYLLGYDMSQEDKCIALNHLKQMSPCQNFVHSVTQLCASQNSVEYPRIVRAINSTNYGNFKEHDNNISINLNFNFNNPTERKYYERFFVNCESTHAFEIAKMLNPTRSSSLKNCKLKEKSNSNKISVIALDRVDCKENVSPFNSKQESEKNSLNLSSDENSEINSFKANENNVNNNGCCKYYKKLNDLDKVIESLNHYEKKMLMNKDRKNFEI